MYFPYLRGRQNELLCLRELLEVDRLYSTIIPIIEPVRCNSTFFTTLKKFIEADRKIIIIKNPKDICVMIKLFLSVLMVRRM